MQEKQNNNSSIKNLNKMNAEVNLKSDTLQQSISDTILRDLKNIWTKLQYVLIPRFQIHDNPEAVKQLRNWQGIYGDHLFFAYFFPLYLIQEWKLKIKVNLLVCCLLLCGVGHLLLLLILSCWEAIFLSFSVSVCLAIVFSLLLLLLWLSMCLKWWEFMCCQSRSLSQEWPCSGPHSVRYHL